MIAAAGYFRHALKRPAASGQAMDIDPGWAL
jgi:hypothetical protein